MNTSNDIFDPDDEILAALRQSPGDPPPGNLYERVAAGVRRRRHRQRALTAGVSAACVVAAIALAPGVLRGNGTGPTPAPSSVPLQSLTPPPTPAVAPSCAPSLESQSTPTRSPNGAGFVPGDPSSAVYCDYAITLTSGGSTSQLVRHAVLNAGQLSKLVAILHKLQPSNEVASCPPPMREQVLLFGYPDGATVTLTVGCAMVWQSNDVHALLDPTLSSVLDSLVPATPSEPPLVSNATGELLELDDQDQLAILDLASGERRPVSLPPTAERATLVATNPAGGWVVAYRELNNGPSRLAVVDATGKFQPFGPASPAGLYVSGLAVRPDGARLAVALMQESAGGAPASIELIPMPGHSGTTESWPVDNLDVNEMISLSWAPDGRQLTYIAGSQTGGGIGGNPSTLDTSKPGKAPTRSNWNVFSGCEVAAAVWLGGSGRFAAARDCEGTATYTEVGAQTGIPAGAAIALPHAGCLQPAIHPSSDASKVLVAECGEVYLISDGEISLVGQQLLDAAWSGRG